MSTLQYRGMIAGATLMLALLSARPSAAQYLGDALMVRDMTAPPPSGNLVNNLITGVQYDVLNKSKAERRLQFLQTKLSRDSEHCNTAAVTRDKRQIERDRYRIAVDDWLIRKNLLCDPGSYPVQTDVVTRAVIDQIASPPINPSPPQSESTRGAMTVGTAPGTPPSPAPTMAITVANAEPTGPGLAFTIDGTSYLAAGGSRQDLNVSQNAIIAFDGSAGPRRYQLAPGLYEFRSTPAGWVLYKQPTSP